MRALLDEDVRDQMSGAQAAILRARVGHLSVAAWELERLVRPCWWDVSSAPKLLSEQGPLRFGIVSADDPVGAPAEGSVGSGTYLLAPVALDELEFNAAAPFATLCIAPSRTQLRALAIPKPNTPAASAGNSASVGLEDLVESYLRWSLAETGSAIGELHRRQVTTRLEEWVTEVCCGPEWAQAEGTLRHQGVWGLLEEVCQELGIGRDTYVRTHSGPRHPSPAARCRRNPTLGPFTVGARQPTIGPRRRRL